MASARSSWAWAEVRPLVAATAARKVVLVATGSEVSLAVETAALLEAQGVGADVVSMPSWELYREKGDKSLLRVSNPARQRVRMSNLAWVGSDGQRTELASGLFGYVLAGQEMQWTIPLSPQQRAKGGTLKVRFNDDPNDQTLPLETAGR